MLFCLLPSLALAADFTDEQRQAIAAIEKHGGKVEADGDGGALKVTLREGDVVDTDLDHLKVLPKVRSLDLSFAWQVTDAGLARLRG
jgi:hypothetical protein